MGAYEEGFADGYARAMMLYQLDSSDRPKPSENLIHTRVPRSKPKRKLSAWNKFVKANSKKPRFIYKSGAKKGKLNLKAMAVAFRKTPAGKKSKK
jgi:hypothetical protein